MMTLFLMLHPFVLLGGGMFCASFSIYELVTDRSKAKSARVWFGLNSGFIFIALGVFWIAA